MTDKTPLQEAMADLHIQILPFDPTKKKKKKKKKVTIQHHMERDDLSRYLDEENEEEDEVIQQSRYPLEGNERDYEYKELLQRVYSFLLEHNPQLAGDKRRSVLRPPLIFSEGSTHTVFANIMDLCKTMQRQPEQLVNFLLIELGTSGLLDEENRLIIRGRFPPNSIEVLLQRYINEYVLCSICRTPDTILSNENHIFLLQCELCGSERSVAPIGAGYGTRSDRRKTGA